MRFTCLQTPVRLTIRTIGLAGSLVLISCGDDAEQSRLSSNDIRLAEIRDFARLALEEEVASIGNLLLSDEKESYIGGSQVRETTVLRDLVHNLGNMMITSYLGDNDNGLDNLSFPDVGARMLRDAHPKGLLCLNSELEIKSNSLFDSGLLGTAAKYPAVVRFSNASNNVQADKNRDIRGLAVQVDTRGSRFHTSSNSHDFVAISSLQFPTDNASQFGDLVKVARIANCSNDVRGFLACAADTGAPNFISLAGSASRLLRIINEESDNGMLEKKFFSVTPFKYENGGQKTYFKFQFEPMACPDSLATDNRSLNAKGKDDFLADNIREILSTQAACYDLKVITMPANNRSDFIEIHTRTWQEMERNLTSVSVGTLRFSQNARELDIVSCDNLRFSPGHLSHGYTALGSLNRARILVYEKLANFRLRVNARIEAASR